MLTAGPSGFQPLTFYPTPPALKVSDTSYFKNTSEYVIDRLHEARTDAAVSLRGVASPLLHKSILLIQFTLTVV